MICLFRADSSPHRWTSVLEYLGHDLVLIRHWCFITLMTVVFCQSIEELETRREINIRSATESRALANLPEKSNTAGKSNLYYVCQMKCTG